MIVTIKEYNLGWMRTTRFDLGWMCENYLRKIICVYDGKTDKCTVLGKAHTKKIMKLIIQKYEDLNAVAEYLEEHNKEMLKLFTEMREKYEN